MWHLLFGGYCAASICANFGCWMMLIMFKYLLVCDAFADVKLYLYIHINDVAYCIGETICIMLIGGLRAHHYSNSVHEPPIKKWHGWLRDGENGWVEDMATTMWSILKPAYQRCHRWPDLPHFGGMKRIHWQKGNKTRMLLNFLRPNN